MYYNYMEEASSDGATGRNIGYARVSTKKQTTEQQIQALKRAGCTPIFAEKMSGKINDRPELAKALAEQMQAQIQDGAIEIESLGQQIIIRIREKAAFPAGSAFLQPQFWPVVRCQRTTCARRPGRSRAIFFSRQCGCVLWQPMQCVE